MDAMILVVVLEEMRTSATVLQSTLIVRGLDGKCGVPVINRQVPTAKRDTAGFAHALRNSSIAVNPITQPLQTLRNVHTNLE
jgi:hypothetical protein